MSNMLPDPTEISGEGPLAGLDRSVRPSRDDNEANPQIQQALQALIDSGMDENEARYNLNLPPRWTPDSPHPEHVHFYEPPEDDEQEPRLVVEARAKLQSAIERTLAVENIQSETLVHALTQLFEEFGIKGGDPGAEPAAAAPASCDLCGAVVADAQKHLRFAHPEFSEI